MPYKIEHMQAAVDFQPLAQPSGTVVPDSVNALQHTRECSPSPPLPRHPSPPQETNQCQKTKMPYKIISPRLGTPGDEYDAADGINIAALIEGGFVEESTNETPKPAKTNSKNSAKD